MIKATQFRQKCCLLATPAQIAKAASRPAREKVAQEASAHQTNDDRQSPISRSCAAPPENANAPWVLRETVCTNCRRARGYFPAASPTPAIAPSRFELRFGLSVAAWPSVHISAGLPKMPVQRRNQRSTLRPAALLVDAPHSPESPTVDGEVLPVLVDRREEYKLSSRLRTVALTLTATDVSAQWRRADGGGDLALPPKSSVALMHARSHHRLPTTGLYGVPRLAPSQHTDPAATGRPGHSTTLQAALWLYPADRYQVCPGYVAHPPPGAAELPPPASLPSNNPVSRAD